MELEHWDDARLLLAVSRAGSLKGAARGMGVHVSTVSRRLDGLEEALGVSLFDRTPDGVVGTLALEQVLPFAESMETAALGVVSALDGLSSEPEGVVRLSAPPGVIEHFLGDLVIGLLDDHPKLRVELLASSAYADLERREADIAIRVRRPTSGDLVALRVVDEVPSALFADKPLVVGRREFDKLRFVTYSEDLAHIPECKWVLSQASLDRVVLRTNSPTAQIQAARGGAGVVVLVDPYEMLEGLVRVKLKPSLARTLPPLPKTSLYLVTHRAMRQVPRVSVTWDRLVARFTP